MNNEQLKAVVTSLETKAGASTTANDGQEGYWKRIAAAAEDIAGASTTANEGLEGYQLRTAVALEATSATTGAEENMTSAGFIKRIVDALEVKSGVVGTSDIFNRLVIAAENASFGPTVNLLPRSQEFDNATWTKTGLTVVANNVTAPDATLTADTATATTTGPALGTQLVSGVSVGNVYTASVYVPAGGNALFAFIQVNANGGGAGASFFTVNRSTGAVSTNQQLTAGMNMSNITSVSDGSGGWRIYGTFTLSGANLIVYFGFSETTASRTSVVGKTCPFWQAQMVEGNVPGPIILRVA